MWLTIAICVIVVLLQSRKMHVINFRFKEMYIAQKAKILHPNYALSCWEQEFFVITYLPQK